MVAYLSFCAPSGSRPKLYVADDVGLIIGLFDGLRVGVMGVERVGRVVSKLGGCGCVGGCRRGDLFLSVKACSSSTVVFSRYRSSDFGLEA